MQNALSVLGPDYASTLASARVLPRFEREIDQVARRLLTFLPKYEPVEKITGVSIVWQATVFEREAGSNFHLYFGNGDPLDRVTTHVPRGRGPFFGDDAWDRGTLDALSLDNIPAISTWIIFCHEGELWNGLGPRRHGKRTGYLWGGTTAYTGGKYVADGVWDPNHYDTQLGIVPVAQRMIELEPSLAFEVAVEKVDAPSIIPAPAPHPVVTFNIEWVQRGFNKLRLPGTPLLVDGNVGRETRAVTREFERRRRLFVDRGIPGPQVVKALTQALAEEGLS